MIMKNKIKIISTICFITLVSNNSYAKSYIDDEINPILLTQPLKRDSLEFKEEVLQIIEMQKTSDNLEVKKAKNESKMRVELMTLDIDEKLTEKNFPKTYRLLQNVLDSSRKNSAKAKNYYNTKRPYLENKKIKALVIPSLSASYPSGHTCGSYVLANILNLLIPEKRQDFYKRAEEIAMHRVLSGMHYPHDIKGGKELAFLVTGALLENEEFKKDFAIAKKELSKFYNLTK